MTDDSRTTSPDLTSRSALRHYYRNMQKRFGEAPPLAGIMINLGLAGFGAIAYLHLTGILAWIGLAWMLVNIYGIIKWGIEQW